LLSSRDDHAATVKVARQDARQNVVNDYDAGYKTSTRTAAIGCEADIADVAENGVADPFLPFVQ
jgi:hypothetical protein